MEKQILIPRGLLYHTEMHRGGSWDLIHKDVRTNGSASYSLLTDFSCLDDIPFLMYRSRGQEEVIVVEGFFDALLLDQARLKPVIGIGNAGDESRTDSDSRLFRDKAFHTGSGQQ